MAADIHHRKKLASVLVMHDEAQALAPYLEPVFPEIHFHYASDPQDIAMLLDRHDPDAVFGIKQSHFPGAPQAAAVSHPSVHWFHVGGAGYEHLGSWDPEKLVVTNCRGVLAEFLAETVTAAMLALNANFLTYGVQQRQRIWKPIAFRSIAERMLLVVGAGAIGSKVAANAKALGMRVLCVKRSPSPVPGADEVHPISVLDDLLGRADFVSVHVPLTIDTTRLFDAGRLARLKPGAIFMNASRGAVVDERALIAALAEGRIGGAYLDVFEKEPLPGESPLWTMPNVLLTPHASDNVSGWQERFALRFAENLKRWNEGRELLGEVQPPAR